jgi:hypothetical protein
LRELCCFEFRIASLFEIAGDGKYCGDFLDITLLLLFMHGDDIYSSRLARRRRWCPQRAGWPSFARRDKDKAKDRRDSVTPQAYLLLKQRDEREAAKSSSLSTRSSALDYAATTPMLWKVEFDTSKF